MGQKVHPRGFRLGIVKPWKSRWFTSGSFGALLSEDETIRRYLHRRMAHAAISEVTIERNPRKISVTLHTGRPGVVVGTRGAGVGQLRDERAHRASCEVSFTGGEI
jgi:small subunit ribosomal protein S3